MDYLIGAIKQRIAEDLLTYTDKIIEKKVEEFKNQLGRLRVDAINGVLESIEVVCQENKENPLSPTIQINFKLDKTK